VVGSAGRGRGPRRPRRPSPAADDGCRPASPKRGRTTPTPTLRLLKSEQGRLMCESITRARRATQAVEASPPHTAAVKPVDARPPQRVLMLLNIGCEAGPHLPRGRMRV
jgi:hypothetical protein